jgi:hypothetical protein
LTDRIYGGNIFNIIKKINKICEQKKYLFMKCYREPQKLRCGTGQEREWFWEMQGERKVA